MMAAPMDYFLQIFNYSYFEGTNSKSQNVCMLINLDIADTWNDPLNPKDVPYHEASFTVPQGLS